MYKQQAASNNLKSGVGKDRLRHGSQPCLLDGSRR